MPGELKAADIARRHNVDRKTAYRWLVEIERKYGPSVVGRRGRVLVTTEDAFAAVAPLVASRSAWERKVRDLEERLDDLEKRGDKQAARLSEMERQLSLRWGTRTSG